jgi:hypothetical protein
MYGWASVLTGRRRCTRAILLGSPSRVGMLARLPPVGFRVLISWLVPDQPNSNLLVVNLTRFDLDPQFAGRGVKLGK